MKNYWLITFLNIDYKIIIKILISRFSKVLTEVTDSFQHALILERRVTDCTMTLNLAIKKLKVENSFNIILSLNIEKIYNRVYYKWLFKILNRLEIG